MRASRVVSAALSFAAATLIAVAARAQTTATGFDLDQFNPSERGSEWFSEDTLDLRGNPGAAVGVVGELAVRPLVLYNPDGSTRSVPVQDSLILHPGGSVTLFSRLRLGIDIPVAAYQNGTSGTASGVSYPGVTSGGVGDLRLGVDVRLFGQYGDPFTVALGAQVFVPSGNTDDYLGDGSFHAILPRGLVAGQVGWFAYAAHLGFHYRGLNTTVAGAQVGSEAVFGASAGVRAVDGKLLFGPELYGATGRGRRVRGREHPRGAVARRALPHGRGHPRGRGRRAGADARVRRAGRARPSVGRVGHVARGASSAHARGAPSSVRPRPRRHPRHRRRVPRRPGRQDRRPEDQRLPARPRPATASPTPRTPAPTCPGVKTDDPEDQRLPARPRQATASSTPRTRAPTCPGVKTDDPKTNGCPPDPTATRTASPTSEDACPDAPGPAQRRTRRRTAARRPPSSASRSSSSSR